MEEKEIIHLDKDDEITSVVDILMDLKEDSVEMVFPKKSQLAEDSTSLKLLKREIDYLGKNVTLIFSDNRGSDVARKVGLNVKEAKSDSKYFSAKRQLSQKKGDKESLISELAQELSKEKTRSPEFGSFSFGSSSVSTKKQKKKKPRIRLANSLGGIRAPSTKKNRLSDSTLNSDDGENKLPRNKAREETKLEKDFYSYEEDTGSETKPKNEETAESLIFSGEESRSRSSFWTKALLSLMGLTVVSALLAGYFILPKCEIVVFPEQEKVALDLDVLGSVGASQLDIESNKLPMEDVQVAVNKTKTFRASGEKNVSRKAHGTITIYNAFSSAPQTLVATTRFKSPEGKIYRIPRTITVPGAEVDAGEIIPQGIDVEVFADQPGEDYNIEETKFTIPGFKGSSKYDGFYGESKEPMNGGAEGKVKVVTEEDIKSAREDLLLQAKEEALAELDNRAGEDFNILKDNFKEDKVEVSFSAEEDEAVDNFIGKIEFSIKAMAYKESYLRELVDLNLESIIMEDKIALSDTLQIDHEKPVINWDKGSALFNVTASEEVSERIDKEDLKNDLAGKGEVEVRKYLSSKKEISKSQVSFWPFWVKKVPAQKDKIEITIKHLTD